MEDPSLANLIHVPMDDIIGNANSTIIGHETESITKRKLPIELAEGKLRVDWTEIFG